MPMVEHKTNVQLTASAVAILCMIGLGFLASLSFANDYLSLGLLCIAGVGVIGGIWLYTGGWEVVGLSVIAISVVVFLLTAWLGTPLLEWKELIR